MRKKLVNEKRDELRKLPRRELIDRILSYPNQDLLNSKEEDPRKKPIGKMAESIQANNYQMSDKQYYTLVHDFAKATVPEVKVVGVTFRKNDPETFVKNPIANNGTRTTYEMDYILQPEPTNVKDRNAVKVLAATESGDLRHIGYLSRDFVSMHHITEQMEVPGYLTDHSNGHFKNVSYSLELDTETIDRRQAIAKEVDNLLDGSYFYEYIVHARGPITDEKKAVELLEGLNLTDAVTDNLSSYSNSGEDVTCKNVSFAFQENRMLTIGVETDQALTGGSMGTKTILNSYMDHRLTSDINTRMKEEGLIAVAPWDDAFRPGEHGFLPAEPPKMMPQAIMYRTDFKLEAEVTDFDAAYAYLTEDDMTKYLKGNIKNDAAAGILPSDFSDDILEVRWELETNDSGFISVLASRELTTQERVFVSQFISGQNSDGLGESFEQQPFASYIDEEYIYDDDDTVEDIEENYVMCSFDWEDNGYRLTDVTEQSETYIQARMKELFPQEAASNEEENVSDAASKPMLTEDDLAFAEQMDLSDFGLY